MIEVVGVQFKGMGRIYYFKPLNIKFQPGEYAIVETVRGVELGKIIVGNKEIDEKQFETELKEVLRKANDEDLKIEDRNNKEAEEAFKIFKSEVERAIIGSSTCCYNN